MFSALLIATVIVCGLAWLPVLSHEGWVVRAFDFPRLQIACLLVLLVGLQILMLDLSQPQSWAVLTLAGAALIYEARWIWHYSPLHPTEVRSATPSGQQTRLRIMIANVLMSNRQAASLLALVRENEPDILLTLESNSWWQERLDALEADYPYTVKCPLENRYGMHVYSRLALSNSCVEYLVEPDKPSIHTQLSLESGDKVHCHFIHPAPPSPTESVDSSERDAGLMVVARSTAESRDPVIVSGDLNDVAWSRTTRMFRKVSGLLDPRVGRGMFNTFHAKYWFIRWPLDHLFHSEHFTLLSIKRTRSYGSDHFALVTEQQFEGDGAWDQQGLEAEHDERLWAEAKHREEGASKEDVPGPGDWK